ncbi:MAG: replicative DNA helicase [Planctomycetota bacterium]|nr:replicative DNA helicase [Planctomycetota bacterium]MDA1212526.1 replicative DNA helicase [Planctomycetota bacterium]
MAKGFPPSTLTPVTELFDKQPPSNLEAERGVIGSMLLLNDTIDEVTELITPEQFYSDNNRKLYEAILSLHEAGVRGIDALTLKEELDRKNELDDIGGVSYVMQVLESVPHAAHARYYASIIRDKAIQRNLIRVCTEILRDSYTSSEETSNLLEKAEQGIFRILESRENNEKFAIRDILMDAFDRLNERWAKGDAISGLPSGFADMDALTNGFQGSELIILAARPSMGKTAFVCNLAESAARESQQGVILFSLEQSKLELAERFLCIRSGVNGHSLRSGELDEDDRLRLLEASQELSETPLFIDDQPGRTISQIAAICRRMKRRHPIGLIIIDYLQLIEPEDKRLPREQQIAQITRRLKALCKEINVPLVALAQLNRGVELREDKRPRLADLRESGAIEQDADLVMFLHRPDAYNPEDQPGLAEIIIAKHRSGPTGIVNLTWLRESMRFVNYRGLTEPAGGYFPKGGGDGPADPF